MTVPPGATIGIVGGGQLGRMLAIAAAQLGYRCRIYAPDERAPAAEVAAEFVRGSYDDEAAMLAFASGLDIVTYEFENIPAAPLAAVAERQPLFPPVRALEIAQDRLAEKNFVVALEGRTAPFAPVTEAGDLAPAVASVGLPALLKTRRFGYDGKGQARIDAPDQAESAWQLLGRAPCILEGLVRFDAEFSILGCRGQGGELAYWDAPTNVHRGGILHRSTAPSEPALASAIAAGRELAGRIATRMDYVGTFAVEFFALGEAALFNELAPRVHNSGHWTIEGALTSQFENHIRAICGLPLGDTARTAPRVEMRNLIGEEAGDYARILEAGDSHLHLYGKRHKRPGRKMGHVTRLLPAE